MPRTVSPLRIATSEWASSCTSTEAKSSSAASRPLAQYAIGSRPGSCLGKYPTARVHVIRA